MTRVKLTVRTFELENVIGPLREYFEQARLRREIVRRFYSFPRQHTDEKTQHLTYMEPIRIMGANLITVSL